MGVTTYGKEENTLLIGNTGSVPAFTQIGSGSGSFDAGNNVLFNTLDVARSFTSTDTSVSRNVNFTTDWDAITMSGLTLGEFGVSAGSDTGLWDHEVLTTPVVFDGSNELQVQLTFEVF